METLSKEYENLLPRGTFIQGLAKLRDTLPNQIHAKFDEHVRCMVRDLSTEVGKMLHNLHEENHSITQVQKVIRAFPSALLCLNHKAWIPIQSCAQSVESVRFVPLLADEAMLYNVNGRNGRGGLKMKYSNIVYTPNVLQVLCQMKSMDKSSAVDRTYTEVLKILQSKKLLKGKDLNKYDLLHASCDIDCKSRFEFLLKLNKKKLKENHCGEPFIHSTITSKTNGPGSFALTLSKTIKYFPRDLGLLFQRNDRKETTFDVAIQFYGKEKTFQIIKECIPTSKNLPILHHVIRAVPESLNDFAMRYPSSIYRRDENGRLFHHLALECGVNLLNNPMMILQMSEATIEECDPVTGLLPFIIAASSKDNDVSTCYHLLRRSPSSIPPI